MVKDAYIHLWDVDAQKDLVEYKIENSDNIKGTKCMTVGEHPNKFRGKTGMFVGEFYKVDGEWEFQAIGEPVRVKKIQNMVELARKKYGTVSGREQSWEEFLANLQEDDDYDSRESIRDYEGRRNTSQRKKSFWERLFG